MNYEINQMIKYLMLPADYIIEKRVMHEDSSLINNWRDEIGKRLEGQNAIILGVPFDTASIQRGAALGTKFLRKYIKSIAPEEDIIDLGDIKVIPHFIHDTYLNKKTIKQFQKDFFQDQQLPVSPLSVTQKVCEEIYSFHPNKKIFGLGGDHSISYPLIKTWFNSRKKLEIETAIIHFDSNSDFESDTIGLKLSNKSWVFKLNESIELTNELIQIGLREKDENASFCTQYTANFTKNNLNKTLNGIIKHLSVNQVEEVYLSFDISCLDKNYAGCTATPMGNGLEPHHCTYLIQGIAQAVKVTGCDIVEVAPQINNFNQNPLSTEPNTTLNNSALIANTFIEVLNNGR